MTSTFGAILVLFDGAIFSTIVIIFPFEISCVTGSAEGSVLIPGIGDGFIIVFVAGVTAQVFIVITRVIAGNGMRVIDWCPTLRGMTGITFRNSNKVIIRALRFTADRDRPVMA